MKASQESYPDHDPISLPPCPLSYLNYPLHPLIPSSTPNPQSQLSSQLKTRLSYAMVKVQNGWQSHTLTELESLTSAPTSPLTSSLRSPRSRPTSSSTTLADRPPSQPHHHPGLDYPTSPTYESFWRDHSDSHPSLAPPADIHPRRPAHAHPPRIHTSMHASPYASPSTPTTPKPRTPSQNAAMEKDAVETLVFMSSPKNSGFQRGNALGTPLRREVGGRGRDERAREVERVLDGASAEESSSSEEEEKEGVRLRIRGGG